VSKSSDVPCEVRAWPQGIAVIVVLLWSYVVATLLTVVGQIRLAVYATPEAWWGSLWLPSAGLVVFSIGLLHLRRWAYWVGVVGSVACLVNVLTPLIFRWLASLALLNGIKAAVAAAILVYLTRPSVRRLFTQDPRPAIAAAPRWAGMLYAMSVVPMFGILLGALYYRWHPRVTRWCWGVSGGSVAVYLVVAVVVGIGVR